MTEVADASSSRLMGWGVGWPEQTGWKMASRVKVITESFPTVKRPPTGSLKGVQCLGKEVVVGVGVAHIWRRSRDPSGGIAEQFCYEGALSFDGRKNGFLCSNSFLSPSHLQKPLAATAVVFEDLGFEMKVRLSFLLVI